MIYFFSKAGAVAVTLSCAFILQACSGQNEPQTKATNVSQNVTEKVAAKPVAVTAEQKILDEGSQLWVDKKPDLAEEKFREAIEQNPESAQAHARLAGLLLTQNKTGDAIPVYQEAITLDPENPKLFASLSIAYLHQSEFEKAQAMAAEALRLSPDMEQAKKLNEYIEKKQEVVELAGEIPAGQMAPKDELHNSLSSTSTAHQSVPPAGHQSIPAAAHKAMAGAGKPLHGATASVPEAPAHK